MADPNLFSIPAGAPFLPTLARALFDGALIEGFPGAGGPLALADATIYVPTQRAASALARELVAASGGAALILPRIAPLGAIEAMREELALFDGDALSDAAASSVSEIARRMTLSRLVRAWGVALRGAIRGVDADGQMSFDPSEPPLVATSPAQAFALSGDLAGLIDDFLIEDVSPERLQGLVADRFDPYWGITLDFLKIAFALWPQWLAERGLTDRARAAALAIDGEIRVMSEGKTRGPTIVAGSTGANRATARLIAAIARAPRGAAVLPDLDYDLDDDAWAMLGQDEELGGAEQSASGIAGHPQAILRRLLATIGVPREAVKPLGLVDPARRVRARFVSEALRPAESTDAWGRRRAAPSEDSLSDEAIAVGLADVAIIIAANEREEALALATAMREALETPDKTAALITPDAAIAHRVAAELTRWGIEIEASAGRRLGDAEACVLARLALATASDFAPASLAALLANPLTLLGRERFAYESAARALELGALRAVTPTAGLDDPAALFAAARASASGQHAHPARRRLSDAQWLSGEALLADAARALLPLRALQGEAPLADFIAAHRSALSALSAERADWRDASGGEALEALFDAWSDGADPEFRLSLADYGALFDAVVAAERAPPGRAAHPRLQILGLLEARLLSFDLALLAGLDETIWPPTATTDAFLNRKMRADLGLSPPERRIGQTAHDFVAALGAPRVILSRAKKRGGAPTVASRFLQRMAAVAGEEAIGAAESRGARYLAFARGLDQPPGYRPSPAPQPRPVAALRPRRLSVTRVETLRRDPYAIYAETILRLVPLAPIAATAGAREIGEVWHAALQAFGEQAQPNDAARLVEIAEAHFAPLLADPSFRALNWPRILDGLAVFLEFDTKRRADGRRVLIERGGKFPFPLADGSSFELTARADRIEFLAGGGAALIDYKTGAPPSKREVEIGLAPQLTLTAKMLAEGAFAGAPAATVVEALYFKLGGAKGGEAKPLNPDALPTMVAEHFAGLIELLDQFADPGTPYLSRVMPKFIGRAGDYDHLARVKEWSATGGQSEDDGAEEV
ncbi:MAG: double-strand break repair protein AddB [Bradyrhizobium sp.]|nr:MAG: double-strand break repair protein AddB [Bradyrhizobium sp.]